MEERKGGRAPLGVKDRRRDGAVLEVAMREIKKKRQFLCFHCEKESRMEKQRGHSMETQHPLEGVIEDISL